MNDREYRDFLKFVFERYVRPRRLRMARRFRHHMEEEWLFHLDRAENTARLLRFIEQECDNPDEIYRTFTRERVARAIGDVSDSMRFADRVMRDGGYYDALDAFGPEIIAGLRPKHLPKYDDDILRDCGSPDPAAERRGLVNLARRRLEREAKWTNETTIAVRLNHSVDELAEENSAFQKAKGADGPDTEPPKKPRRWFKGLGQIAQGAALSIADVAVAAGALHVPVSPETQTWGAIVSVVTGIGTILNGIGDLRGE